MIESKKDFSKIYGRSWATKRKKWVNELYDTYNQAYNLLRLNGWEVSKEEYTTKARGAGLTESHIWAIWLGGDALEQMEKLWLNDKLDLKNYSPHVAREKAYEILEKGGWKLKWDNTPLGQGYINWFIEVDGGDLGSDMYLVYENEDVMASPNRPLGILLSIGVIAWFVKLLRP